MSLMSPKRDGNSELKYKHVTQREVETQDYKHVPQMELETQNLNTNMFLKESLKIKILIQKCHSKRACNSKLKYRHIP